MRTLKGLLSIITMLAILIFPAWLLYDNLGFWNAAMCYAIAFGVIGLIVFAFSGETSNKKE